MLTKNIQYKFDNFILIPSEGLLLKNGEVISLTYRAFKVLELMVRKAGRVIMKEEFMETVWENSFVEEGNLPVAVNAIRKVLHADGRSIVETFSRRGYRLNCQVEILEVKETPNSLKTIENAQPYQTVGNVQILGSSKNLSPNPANFFPKLSKIVPAKILQIFLPAATAQKNSVFVVS